MIVVLIQSSQVKHFTPKSSHIKQFILVMSKWHLWSLCTCMTQTKQGPLNTYLNKKKLPCKQNFSGAELFCGKLLSVLGVCCCPLWNLVDLCHICNSFLCQSCTVKWMPYTRRQLQDLHSNTKGCLWEQVLKASPTPDLKKANSVVTEETNTQRNNYITLASLKTFTWY